MTRVLGWIGPTILGFGLIGTGLHFPGSLDNVGPNVGSFVFGAATGLIIGTAQLWSLRGLARPLWMWLLATAAGLGVTHAIGDGLPFTAGYLPVALGGGLATGMLQGLVLRSPLWPVATTIAFLVGIVGGYALANELGSVSVFADDSLARHRTASLLTGAAYALLTAPLLARKWAVPGAFGDQKR